MPFLYHFWPIYHSFYGFHLISAQILARQHAYYFFIISGLFSSVYLVSLLSSARMLPRGGAACVYYAAWWNWKYLRVIERARMLLKKNLLIDWKMSNSGRARLEISKIYAFCREACVEKPHHWRSCLYINIFHKTSSAPKKNRIFQMLWCIFEGCTNRARPSQPFLKYCQNGTF
jgi:hypothetical protein